MIPKMTEEMHLALTTKPNQPLQVEDPVTHARYVLIGLDAFEQLQRAAEFDTSEADPRLFYQSFAAAVKNDLDAP